MAFPRRVFRSALALVQHIDIGPRLIAGFLLLAIVCAFVGYRGLAAAARLNSVIDNTNANTLRRILHLDRVRTAVLVVQRAERILVLAVLQKDEKRCQKQYDKIEKGWQDIGAGMTDYTALPMTDEEESQFREIRAALAVWQQDHDAVVRHARNGDAANAEAVCMAEWAHSAARLNGSLTRMMEIQSGLVEREQNAAAAGYRVARVELLSVIGLAVVVAVGLGLFLSLSVTRPLGETVDVLSAVAKGDLSCQADASPRDEVGRMAAALNAAIGALRAAEVRRREYAELTLRAEALRASEAGLRELADTLPQLVWGARPDGHVDYVNRRWNEQTGFESFSAGEECWIPYLHPDDVERTRQAWHRAVRTGEPYQIEYRLKFPVWDHYRWHLARALPVRDAAGRITRWYGTRTDIHDQKQAEEALRDANARLGEQNRLAALQGEVGLLLNQDAPLSNLLRGCCAAIHRHVDAAFVRVWTLNEGTRVLELQASVGLYTHTDGQHARIPVGQFKIGRIAEDCAPHLTNNLATDPQVSDPAWVAREGLVAFAGHPLVVSGRVVGVLALFSHRPLSDRMLDALKVAADALALGIVRKRMEANLRESEERYRQLFDSNPHPMWAYDAETFRFLAVNSAAIQHYGYSRAEFLAMTIQQLTPPDALGPKPRPFDNARLCCHRLASGVLRWVEVADNPIEFGGREAVLVLALDVTARKLLEDELRQAQKLESIGQLAAGIAHEINTPIQYIGDNTTFLQEAFQGFTEVLALYRASEGDPARLAAARQLAEQAELDYLVDEVPRAARQTLDGVRHVARIVKAMKEFAYPGTEEKVPVNLNHAIETVVTVARNEWKYAAEMRIDLDPDLPPVQGLPGELNQVFLNLLVNAAHAIQAAVGGDGKKGAITISTRRSGATAEVRVADTGCGIPEGIRGKVFDPFFTTKPVGQGTGQGLAIVHAVVVQRHGGVITFESEVGRGTTFVVRLPLDGGRITASEFIKTSSTQRVPWAGHSPKSVP